MAETQEYIALLTPTDMPLGEATETRAIPLELDADLSENTRYDTAERRISRSGDIDAWSFRNHWDLAHLARDVEDDAEQIRELFRGCTYPTEPRRETAVPHTVYLRDWENNRWTPTTLTVSTATRERVRVWADEFREEFDVECSPGELHHAMIEAVATVREDFPAEFIETPKDAQGMFLKTVVTNDEAVFSAVQESCLG